MLTMYTHSLALRTHRIQKFEETIHVYHLVDGDGGVIALWATHTNKCSTTLSFCDHQSKSQVVIVDFPTRDVVVGYNDMQCLFQKIHVNKL